MPSIIKENCMREDQTYEESVAAYGDLAPQYNTLLRNIKYRGPRKCAEVLSELLPCKRVVKILDVACSTGLVAESLRDKGFTCIDGVDPSQGMLDVAAKTGVYNNLICSFVGVGDSQLPVENDNYDAATLCGGMGQNMMPCDGIHEMIRVVKPGGYIVNIFREEILTTVEEYRDRLEPLMESLERNGKWKRIARTIYPDYHVGKTGLINIHQVC